MLYFRAFWGLFMAGCGAHNIDRLDSYVSENYGVDVSYPITHFLDPNTYQGKRYEAMMQGCYEFYSYEECMRTEIERLKMSIEQPRSQFNYTDLGFQVGNYCFTISNNIKYSEIETPSKCVARIVQIL